jgi:cytochrome b subunit of formate dehydrogenase
MGKLSKILILAFYLSIMCLVISGLIIPLWNYPKTSFLVDLFKTSVVACIFFGMAYLGIALYEELK